MAHEPIGEVPIKRFLALAWLTGFLMAGATAESCLAQDENRELVEAEAMGQAGEADRHFKAGDFAAALPLYEAERASRAKLGDLRYEAYAARAVGCCHEGLGDLDAAIVAWKAARELDARRADKGFEGYDWLLIGKVELRRHQTSEAVAALSTALPLLSKAVDRDHEIDARLLLARALLDRHEAEAAQPHVGRAVSLADALRDPFRLAVARAESGRVALALGEPGPAAEWLSDAGGAFSAEGRTAEAAEVDRLLGDALLSLGRPDVAEARVERALHAHTLLHDATGLGDDLEFLSALRVANGDLPAARDLARRVVVARRDADDPVGEVEAMVALAHCESLLHDWPAAATTLDAALKLARRDGDPADQVRLLILAADVEGMAKHQDRSQTLLDEAKRVAERARDAALIENVIEASKRIHHK